MAYTIFQDVQTEMTIERSRFLCTLHKVRTEEEAQAFIKELKKHYWDATHNCSAYLLGEGGECQRSSDDGEPSGTAGLPMLEVLRKKKLVGVAAVVTRYFGGIKLGAGGLVRAYSNSVIKAVAAAGMAERVLMGVYVFRWQVEDVGRVLHILYRQELFSVGEVEYGTEATISLIVEASRRAQIEAWLTDALNTQVTIEEKFLTVEERRI